MTIDESKLLFSKKQLSNLISKQIKITFQELLDLSLGIDEELKNLNFSAVKSSLIKMATPKEMAQISKLCGELFALFKIANSAGIILNNKTLEIEKWTTLVDSYLDSKFPVLLKKKKNHEMDI